MEEKDSYQKALDAVIEIRQDRKKLYGDTWKKDEDWMLMAQIHSKTTRLKNLIIDRNMDSNGYDSIIDSSIDLINYTLFLLANKLERKKDHQLEKKCDIK